MPSSLFSVHFTFFLCILFPFLFIILQVGQSISSPYLCSRSICVPKRCPYLTAYHFYCFNSLLVFLPFSYYISLFLLYSICLSFFPTFLFPFFLPFFFLSFYHSFFYATSSVLISWWIFLSVSQLLLSALQLGSLPWASKLSKQTELKVENWTKTFLQDLWKRYLFIWETTLLWQQKISLYRITEVIKTGL